MGDEKRVDRVQHRPRLECVRTAPNSTVRTTQQLVDARHRQELAGELGAGGDLARHEQVHGIADTEQPEADEQVVALDCREGQFRIVVPEPVARQEQPSRSAAGMAANVRSAWASASAMVVAACPSKPATGTIVWHNLRKRSSPAYRSAIC